jgi:hypothetical protein
MSALCAGTVTKIGRRANWRWELEPNFDAICDEMLQERDEQPISQRSIARSGDMGDVESFVDA